MQPPLSSLLAILQLVERLLMAFLLSSRLADARFAQRKSYQYVIGSRKQLSMVTAQFTVARPICVVPSSQLRLSQMQPSPALGNAYLWLLMAHDWPSSR